MVADATELGGAGERSAGEESPGQRLALAVVAFLLLFGQPVFVFALAVLTPTLPSLAVIGGGTVLLAVPMARAFVRQGGSLSRLGDFVLVLAFAQVSLALLGRPLLDAVEADVVTTAVQPGIVLVSYPVAYYVSYRRPAAARSIWLRS